MTTGSRARARSHSGFVPPAIAAAVALALAVATAAVVPAAPTQTPLPVSNSELLAEAARVVARRLVGQAPLTPGARVALQAEGDRAVDREVQEALLMAFNERHIPCVLLEPLTVSEPVEEGEAAADTTTTRKKGDPPTSNAPDPNAVFGTQGGVDFTALQAQRKSQAALAESLARADSLAGGPATGATQSPAPKSVLAGGAGGNLPVITFRVPEARVDYVRQFRGGIFGAQRMERRASARVTMHLTAPGATAVSWSASADTSLGDIVLKNELSSLEDRTRPETRPTPPAGGAKKIIEPILVILLVVGLVSLFYQNRP